MQADRPPSTRAAALAARLGEASAAFVTVIESIPVDRWAHVPAPGVWSPGKEAEHVAEALGYHQWIVQRTVGARVSSRRPSLERKQMTSDLSPAGAADRVRAQTEVAVGFLRRLTDRQLDLAPKPTRAAIATLAGVIEEILISHVDSHRASIAEKLRR